MKKNYFLWKKNELKVKLTKTRTAGGITYNNSILNLKGVI
jgi:hypothetical protein